MSINTETKINKLLQLVPPGTVILAEWLTKIGYSRELQHRYVKNSWLTSIGYGAFIRAGDTIGLNGAVYALQFQSGKDIHIGGRTALSMQGFAHYLELYQKESLLFAQRGKRLPTWLKNNKWDTKPVLIHSSMLPPGIGLAEYKDKSFTIKISDPTRAFLECLEMTPDRFDLMEAWHIMEGLSSLPPAGVQELLEKCNSAKVIRLFLFLAEKAGHAWFKYLHTDSLKMGKGKRSIVPAGAYISKYQITVPKELK